MSLLEEIEKRLHPLGWTGLRTLFPTLPVRVTIEVVQEQLDELRAQAQSDRENFQRQIDRLAARR